jgi:hypothetical protein
LILLALPREARDFNEINGLRKGLGNIRLIELQGNSAGRPKPFPRPHENDAPAFLLDATLADRSPDHTAAIEDADEHRPGDSLRRTRDFRA